MPNKSSRINKTPHNDMNNILLILNSLNPKANPDEHIDILIKAAENLRKLVQSMENLEEIKGFITYSTEEKKQQKPDEVEEGEEKEEKKTIQQLKEEVGEKIINA